MPSLPKIAAPPSFDEPSVREHAAMLHQLATGLDGVLVVSTFFADPVGGNDRPGAVSHHEIGDVDGTVESIMAHSVTANANVFAGLQVMRRGLARGSRGTEADIVAVLGLVVDLDADTGNAGEMPVPGNLELETSPGNCQPFVLFDRPLAVAEAKPLAAALKRATGSDHGTADVTHVWRIPGTLNWPNKKKLDRGRSPAPVPVTFIESWDGSLTSVEELRAALQPWTTVEKPTGALVIGALPKPTGIELSLAAIELLSADDVGDRSAHAAKVVEQLAFDGLTVEQACAAFLAASGDWFERYKTRNPKIDFARLWQKFGSPKKEEREQAVTLAKAFIGSATKPVAANDNEPAELSRDLPDLPPMHTDPFSPASAGGLLQSISSWITDTAIIPVPELSLTAAIALIAGIFGEKALGPTRSGVNLFLTTVMGVASGKGHAPKSIIHLATAAGRPGAVTNGDPTSYAAIERMLRKNSSTVVVMDEFGVTLQDVNNKRSNGASASIRKFLLAIYDQADSFFHGRQYASSETKGDDSPIKGPALTVLGMTTPSTLYAGLSEDSLGDGFLSRFVFIEGQGPDVITPPSLNREAKLPKSLKQELEDAFNSFPASENPLGINKFSVPFEGGEGGAGYAIWADIFRWQNAKAWSDREHHVNGRAAENTIRLATLRAISRDPRDPAVTADDVRWGWAIVYRSIQIVTEGVDRHMSGSSTEALRKAIIRALEKAPDGQLPWSYLLQREGVSSSRKDDVAEAIQWLIETDKVVDLTGKSKPGPRCRFKLVA